MHLATRAIQGAQIYGHIGQVAGTVTARLRRREMIKKIVDVLSLASIAVFVGVVIWLAMWGASPHAPGRLPIQSKLLGWDAVPIMFGVNWLIVRYANSAIEKFPRAFGRRGLLFYFSLVLAGFILLSRLFLILSKLLGG